jgi:hypothetical protein
MELITGIIIVAFILVSPALILALICLIAVLRIIFEN